MNSEYQALQVQIQNGIAVVAMSNPPRNAMNQVMIHELKRIWADLTHDDNVSVIVFTGAGDNFSVGGDIKMLSTESNKNDPAVEKKPTYATSSEILRDLLDCEKPIISAINGHCAGLAATIALFCDISILADDAKIGDPHTKIGLVAGDGSAVIWPMLIGVNRAKEYLMRGKMMPAAEAERIGLVNHVRPRKEVLPLAMEIARELADGAPWAIRWTKQSINKAIKAQMNLIYDASHALEMITITMEDHNEATRAFIEKRKPMFKGY